jgi:hypothetical protein
VTGRIQVLPNATHLQWQWIYVRRPVAISQVWQTLLGISILVTRHLDQRVRISFPLLSTPSRILRMMIYLGHPPWCWICASILKYLQKKVHHSRHRAYDILFRTMDLKPQLQAKTPSVLEIKITKVILYLGERCVQSCRVTDRHGHDQLDKN